MKKQQVAPMTHLLIDEFQDISPQIVAWIKSSQKAIAVSGSMPSIMAIGDDWQSIYGWRGSSPRFFIDFDNYFPCHEAIRPARKCEMSENFRSIQAIVSDAARLLVSVEQKTEKAVCSNVIKYPGDHGVALISNAEAAGIDVDGVAALISEQYALVSAQPTSDKTKIIVVARTNDMLEDIKVRSLNAPDILYLTIHKAKGLQGEVAIICEDPRYDQRHEIRNRACYLVEPHETINGTGTYYDDAMSDEANRLAYVAVTRGVRRVFWFAGEGTGASKIFLSK